MLANGIKETPRLGFLLPSPGIGKNSKPEGWQVLAQIKAQYHDFVDQLQLPCGIMNQTCYRSFFFSF